MKTYEIVTNGESVFVKTGADSDQVRQAINFIASGAEPNIEKLLQALRTLGFKATQVKLEPIDIFEL